MALEKEKKVLEESAAEKDALLQKKVKTIGNYVHDSVPISNNEVSYFVPRRHGFSNRKIHRTTTL